MSPSDKAKLDSTGQKNGIATLDENGIVQAAQLPMLKGATASAAGSSGLVPAPNKGVTNQYLGSDGSWTSFSNATTTVSGLMSPSDKAKLDGISSGANKYTHPSYAAKDSGLYKVTVDSTGHVSATTTVTKADITSLGLPAYATCTTDAGTKNKEISIDNFILSTGATIRIKFINNNSAASPNLVINKDENNIKPIYCYYKDANNNLPAGVSDITSGWKAGAIVTLTYDGYRWIRDYWENSYRGIQNNLTSTSTTDSLSAAQGKVLKDLVDSHTHNYAGSSSAGGAATSANKLNTDAGSESQPIYFKNGVPVPCTNLGLTTIIETITTQQAGTIIRPPSNIISNLTSGQYNLSIYHNGILLTEGTHYYLTAQNSILAYAFTYDYKTGDIFTFKLTPKYITSIDLSGYLTKEVANDLYMPKSGDAKSFLATFGGTMTGSINMGQQNITNCNSITATTITASGKITGNQVFGAVWNDYAEYRIADTVEPGNVVCENGDDTMSISKERMQPGAAIVSDTFGFAIGETDKAKAPIAVSGRVLAKPYEPIEEFKKAIGRPVCAGPNGTVSIMTDEEYATKGYCAIGTISAVPNYTTWGDGIKVNNRIWIKVG